MSRKTERPPHDVLPLRKGSGSDRPQTIQGTFKVVHTNRGVGRSFFRVVSTPKVGKIPGFADLARRPRQALQLVLARKAFLKEFGDPATGVRQRSLDGWHQEGKIFTVADGKTTYVPSFQFDERGHPRPVVARIIQVLGGSTSDWGMALWFAAANGWLDGRRPVDLLASAPEEVVEAAEREAEELVV
jgi:hypothetical protein